MSKKLQRKKQLRNSLRRSGALSNAVNKVVEETKKVVKHAEKAASDAGKAVWMPISSYLVSLKTSRQVRDSMICQMACLVSEIIKRDRFLIFY